METAAAIAVLRAGGVVGMPTETVYGLAADARDARAVARVFAVKRRPAFDPLIVHVASAEEAWALVGADRVSGLERRLGEAFWPGPLTLVLTRPAAIPTIVTAGLDTVGVRVPDHAVALEMIRGVGPLAAPSANLFGRVSPTRAEHVVLAWEGEPVGVVDGGACRTGVESTVVRVKDGRVWVLRPGGVSVEALRDEVGDVVACVGESSRSGSEVEEEAMASPGMTASHYAPGVPVVLAASGELPADVGAWGLLSFAAVRDDEAGAFAAVRVLSASGDDVEAASNLFRMIRELDGSGVAGIVATRAPSIGLGVAINDRLRRAATRSR